MTDKNLSSLERQRIILEQLNRQTRISVAEICEQFLISEATARRDLEVLSDQKLIQRVHGGAIALMQAPPEMPILQRQSEHAEEKRRISLAAAQLVQDGETIFLGSGTSVLEVARALRERRNITVITNSLPVLNTLSGSVEITLVALGGILRASELSFIGHITEQALAEVRADRVFIGVRAIHPEHGLTNDYLPETMTDRAILRAGSQVIVVADHSKVNMVSTAYLASIQSIQILVTGSQAPVEFVSALQRLGVEVIQA